MDTRISKKEPTKLKLWFDEESKKTGKKTWRLMYDMAIDVDISPSTVEAWINGDRKPAANKIQRIIKFTKNELTEEDLRPDFFELQ